MDRILIILKKENGRASSAPALGLNTIIFKYVYWYMKQISGERLQDHWSSGFMITSKVRMKPRWPDSLSLSSNQGRENDSVSIKHCTGSYSEYI